ncbi:MAG: hypothetical protein PHH84_03130 [Oscillospiraceae bacterium]|nr:hypothetical protein [Oscillospiraceae bacterium]MDD4413203.1 hypothetical protein [Oscillospiraceae bacterium]
MNENVGKVINMPTVTLIKEPQTIKSMANAKKIINKTIQQKNLSSSEIKKSLGIKRYEK